MKKLITILLILLTTNANGQALKKLYDKVFKYSTIYVAGDVKELMKLNILITLLERIQMIYMLYQM